jgi:hypothetical protein
MPDIKPCSHKLEWDHTAGSCIVAGFPDPGSLLAAGSCVCGPAATCVTRQTLGQQPAEGLDRSARAHVLSSGLAHLPVSAESFQKDEYEWRCVH